LRAIDVVHEGQEFVGGDFMLLHQAPQRRAVALVVIFLKRARRQPVEAEHMREEHRDARVDFRPEVAARRIERVVEIEHPRVDMREARARFGREQGRRGFLDSPRLRGVRRGPGLGSGQVETFGVFRNGFTS